MPSRFGMEARVGLDSESPNFFFSVSNTSNLVQL